MTLLHQLMAAERQRELLRVAAEVRRAAPRPARRWAWRRRTPDGGCPAPVAHPRPARS